MITWFLFLFSTLFVAWLFVYFGSLLARDPSTPLSKAIALKSKELPEDSPQWMHAKKMYGQAEMKGGYGLAIVAAAGMLCVLNQEQQTIFIAGDLILALEILYAIGLRFWTLSRLKKNPAPLAEAKEAEGQSRDLWTHPAGLNPESSQKADEQQASTAMPEASKDKNEETEHPAAQGADLMAEVQPEAEAKISNALADLPAYPSGDSQADAQTALASTPADSSLDNQPEASLDSGSQDKPADPNEIHTPGVRLIPSKSTQEDKPAN